MSPITSSPTCSLKWVLVKRVSALLLQPGALQYESWLPLSAPSTTLSTRLLINSNPRVPRGHAGSQTGFGGLSVIAFQAWVMRVAALSQQGREGELCKGDWGHLRKASRARNDSAGAGQGRASASARGQEQRNLQTGIQKPGSNYERSAECAQRACAVRACACAAAIAKALGCSEAHAGGPRWLCLPEGTAAAPGRRRSPPGARPRCVRWAPGRAGHFLSCSAGKGLGSGDWGGAAAAARSSV